MPELKLGADTVVLAIMLVISLVITPVVVDQVQGLNTTGWTFTGAAGAKTLLLLIPFVWIAGLVVAIILNLLGKT